MSDAVLHVGSSRYEIDFREELPPDEVLLVPHVSFPASPKRWAAPWVNVEFSMEMCRATFDTILEAIQRLHIELREPPLPGAPDILSLPVLPCPALVRDRRATLKRQALGLPPRTRYRRV